MKRLILERVHINAQRPSWCKRPIAASVPRQTVYKPAVLPVSPARVAAGGGEPHKIKVYIPENNFFYKPERNCTAIFNRAIPL